MSLNAILNTATSGLQTNQSALRVTSNNIANVNTPGYHRRVVDLGPRLTGGQLTGVTVDEVRRITDTYLMREATNASGAGGRADTLASYFDRVQDLVGSLDGSSSLGERISSAMTALAQLSADPASTPRRNSAVTSVTSALNSISGMASNVQSLRQDANLQLTSDITKVNQLISHIYDLNLEIKAAFHRGDTATGLLDQRDNAIDELAKFVDIKTFEQGDGRVFVTLSEGTTLVSDMSSELRYPGPSAVSANISFPSITLQRIDPESGNDIGSAVALESRIQGGEIRGLIDMRDKHLPDLAEQLGLVGASLADQLNAIHNNSSSVPPPASMTGRNTGLVGTDALNFTGRATVAVVDAQGALVQSVNLDLSTYTTIDDMVAGINAALGGNATATFANGALSITANNSGEGVAFLQDPTTPASRGGRGLAHFFGMNDLVTAASQSHYATGVAGTDAHQISAGTAEFVLRGTDGAILNTFSVTVGGSTFDDIISDLNTAAGGYATFSLDTNGTLVMTPAAAYAGARLEVRNDTTDRGSTGVSLTQFFGMGSAVRQNQATNLAVRSDIVANSSKMALAQLDISGTTVPGDTVLGVADNRGALQLAAVANASVPWVATGGLASGSMSIGDYVAQVMGAQADLANAAETERLYRQDVSEEVAARRSAVEGVNLDEELSAMMVYQQAYNASARLMTVVQQMYDTLINVV